MIESPSVFLHIGFHYLEANLSERSVTSAAFILYRLIQRELFLDVFHDKFGLIFRLIQYFDTFGYEELSNPWRDIRYVITHLLLKIFILFGPLIPSFFQFLISLDSQHLIYALNLGITLSQTIDEDNPDFSFIQKLAEFPLFYSILDWFFELIPQSDEKSSICHFPISVKL
jgi:hypothetical protein